MGAYVAGQTVTAQVWIDPEKFHSPPDGTIGFDEQINLHTGEELLYIMVRDKDSRRSGVVYAPMDVPKRAK